MFSHSFKQKTKLVVLLACSISLLVSNQSARACSESMSAPMPMQVVSAPVSMNMAPAHSESQMPMNFAPSMVSTDTTPGLPGNNRLGGIKDDSSKAKTELLKPDDLVPTDDNSKSADAESDKSAKSNDTAKTSNAGGDVTDDDSKSNYKPTGRKVVESDKTDAEGRRTIVLKDPNDEYNRHTWTIVIETNG